MAIVWGTTVARGTNDQVSGQTNLSATNGPGTNYGSYNKSSIKDPILESKHVHSCPRVVEHCFMAWDWWGTTCGNFCLSNQTACGEGPLTGLNKVLILIFMLIF